MKSDNTWNSAENVRKRNERSQLTAFKGFLVNLDNEMLTDSQEARIKA